MTKKFNSRRLNDKGTRVYNRTRTALTVLFTLITLMYAAFRSKDYAEQLPATFITKTKPSLLTIPFIKTAIPFIKPAKLTSFEFPVVSLCVLDTSLIKVSGCFYKTLGRETKCELNGIYKRNMNVGTFGNLECVSIGEYPSALQTVASIQDSMKIKVDLEGNGGISGILVVVHGQGNATTLTPEFNSWFTASTGTLTEVEVVKVWKLPLKGEDVLEYETRASSMNVNNSTQVDLSFHYESMEITYMGEFLPLSKESWLGEIGGFGALMFFIRGFMMIWVLVYLARSEKYSVGDYNEEGARFERF